MMKQSALALLSGTLLALGTGPLHAQPASLESNPAVKDLGPAANPAALPTPKPVAALPAIQLVRQFDRNGNGRLDATERQAARDFLARHPPPDPQPAPLRPGQPAPLPVALEPVHSGAKISLGEVIRYPDRPAYDATVVRTLFLKFAETDWESELAEFARTDVLVPAELTVDGRKVDGVGVHFHSTATSNPLPPGYKRSLEINLDYTDAHGQLAGQRRLRLFASSTDPTFLRSMLYSRVAREYLPSPKTDFVQVVINGEDWGIYINTQPLDDGFLQENYHTTGGARWEVSGSGNLGYRGDLPDAYRADYRLRSPEDPAAWTRLVELCRTIEKAEPGHLEEALTPLLDLDGALRFFALQNALINQSGYGTPRGSYGLFLDDAGLFHLIPQDAEASFRLVEVNEYGKAPRREGGAEARPDTAGGKTKGKKGPDQPAKPIYDRTHFPRQSGTDLAMLLSYSFVNKADTDFDGQISREEWKYFARAWFFVMDEDQTGSLTRDQFIDKVRLLVTPVSITDGRTRQTFGKDDPASMIGGQLFAILDRNHDGTVTKEEFGATFDDWFDAWTKGKSPALTQTSLQAAFDRLFTQTVFQADQTYIATRDGPKLDDESGGDRDGGRGKRGGSGINLGPIHLPGLGRFGGKGSDDQTLLTYSEELDPLAGLDDATQPLLARLLAAPALRARYLKDLNDITENWLSWKQLGPTAQAYHDLIADDVKQDTHKATSYEHFVKDFDQDTTNGAREGDAAPSLKAFIDERGNYLRKDDTVSGNPVN
jgi:Ca2+-binding EF-hand superfamily protein